MSAPEPRRRYNVGLTKIAWRHRDVAHAVLTERDDHGYRDVIGSDTIDHDERFPVGAEVAYSVELTDAEAERFAAASNLRYLEEAERHWPARAVGRPTGTLDIPRLATLAWMRARYVDLRTWHGRDVPIAVLDQGTTQAVRDAMGYTLLARTVTSGITLGPGQELARRDHPHGCWVATNAVPAGGLLLDAVIVDDSGGSFDTWEAAAITWAVDNGANLINLSFNSSGNTGAPTQVMLDAFSYARDNGGVQIVISAGNDNLSDITRPAGGSRTHANVHSAIAFDECTDRRGLFSNYAADASGCMSGVEVDSLSIHARRETWSGTSAAAPHMVQLMARALTGAQFTPAQVGAAFKANTRVTDAPAAEQGGGAYDLQRALAALGGVPATAGTAGVAALTHVDSRGVATTPASYNLTPATGVAVDDMQLVVLASSAGAGIVVPPGWTLLTDLPYFASYEISAGQTVGPTRIRVLAKPYTADQPASVSLSMGGGTWFSALLIMTLRGAGGLDPERFAPAVQFGTGGSITTHPVLPATTNDLLVTVFSQRHPTATTGTLSLPAGLTQRGFWRPSSGTTGYTLLAATTQLASGARTASYTSTSNDATGTWCSLALTVPAGALPIDPITQAEPAGPIGGLMPLLPHA